MKDQRDDGAPEARGVMSPQQEVRSNEAATYALISYGLSSSLLYSMVITGRMTKAEAEVVVRGAITAVEGISRLRALPEGVLNDARNSLREISEIVANLP